MTGKLPAKVPSQQEDILQGDILPPDGKKTESFAPEQAVEYHRRTTVDENGKPLFHELLLSFELPSQDKSQFQPRLAPKDFIQTPLIIENETRSGKSQWPAESMPDAESLIEALKKAMAQENRTKIDPSCFYPPASGRVTCDKSDEAAAEADRPKVEILPPPKLILIDEFEKHDPRPLRHLQNLLHEADPYSFPFKLGEDMEYCAPHDLRDGTTIDGTSEDVPCTARKTDPSFKLG